MTTMTKVQTRPLPSGWQWKRLSDVLTDIDNGSRPRGGVAGIKEGILSIGAEHISEHGALYLANPRYISKEFFSRMSKGIVKPGDILLVKDGATTGRAALIEKVDKPGFAVNEHVFILRPDKAAANSLYLFYALFSPWGQRAILKSFHGAAQGGITQDFTKSVWIPMPVSIREQELVVKKLKDQMAEAQCLRLAAVRQAEAADALRLSLLHSVFNSSEIQGFPHTSLGEISSLITDGPHVTPTYLSAGVPFLTVRNIVNRYIDLSDVSFISQQDHFRFSQRVKPMRGDILYTKDGTMGVPCVVDLDIEFSFFVSVALIRLNRECANPYYVTFALDSPYVLNQVKILGAGSGLKHMVLESIRKLEIPLPPLDIQEQIVIQLKEKLVKTQGISMVTIKQLEAINALTNVILQQTFGGFTPPAED